MGKCCKNDHAVRRQEAWVWTNLVWVLTWRTCLGNGAAGCGDVRGGGTDVDKSDTQGFAAPWMGAGTRLAATSLAAGLGYSRV